MNRTRLVLLALALATATGVAGAQDAPRDRARDGHRGPKMGHPARMFRGVDLTDAQRQQIRAIHDRYRPQLQQLNADARTHMEAARDARQRGDTAGVLAHRQQARAAMEATRAQREQLHARMRAELRAVLTPAQQQELDERRERMRERMERRRERGARPGAGRGFRGPRGSRIG